MMKMYHRATHAGEVEFWEKNWADGQLEAALRFCEVDPLRPLFERYVPEGSRLLEGGCGRGQYVLFYDSRGVRVVGLDFAGEALRRLRSRAPRARLCQADVAQLPFAQDAFDAYYSGGVVEHFENGPLPALREAYRVLRRGGVLLASVPYLSPLRRLSRLWRSDRRFVEFPFVEGADSPRRGFWQYAFGEREFARILVRSGFAVHATLPYAILFGLYDLPFVDALLAGRPGTDTSAARPQPPAPASQARSWSVRALLKRLLVAEDRRLPVFGPLVGATARLCGNMMMYVAVK